MDFVGVSSEIFSEEGDHSVDKSVLESLTEEVETALSRRIRGRGRPLVIVVLGDKDPRAVHNLVKEFQQKFGNGEVVGVLDEEPGRWEVRPLVDAPADDVEVLVTNGLVPAARGRRVAGVCGLDLPRFEAKQDYRWLMERWCEFLDVLVDTEGSGKGGGGARGDFRVSIRYEKRDSLKLESSYLKLSTFLLLHRLCRAASVGDASSDRAHWRRTMLIGIKAWYTESVLSGRGVVNAGGRLPKFVRDCDADAEREEGDLRNRLERKGSSSGGAGDGEFKSRYKGIRKLFRFCCFLFRL